MFKPRSLTQRPVPMIVNSPLAPAFALLLLALLAPVTVMGQTLPLVSRATVEENPNIVHLHLMDGSVVSGVLSVEAIELKTDFGLLTIPITRIERVTPGLDQLPALREEIDTLIRELGVPDATARDKAQNRLVAIGPVIEDALTRAKGLDPEQKLRIEAIREAFEEQRQELEMLGEPEPEPIKAWDVIQTDQFTVTGVIQTTSYELASKYGPLQVALSDIRRIERLSGAGNEEIRRTIKVSSDAIAPAFKSSGIRVQRGDRIVISADGQLQMTPWGSNAVSGPDGAPNYGWYIQNEIPMGALIVRIGSSGTGELVGTSKTFRAESSGMLQLAIGMHQGYSNRQFPGEYRVRVQVRSHAE